MTRRDKKSVLLISQTPKQNFIYFIHKRLGFFAFWFLVPANKMDRRNRFHLLCDVVGDNKELVSRPAICLVPSIFSLFSFPLLVVSFSIGCQNVEMSSLRYSIISCYFMSFMPQILTYFLYVYPSSVYSNEWRQTIVGKWICTNTEQNHPTKSARTEKNMNS